MSPVRRHFWQVVARVKSSLHHAHELVLELVHAGRREQHRRIQRGTSTSLGRRMQPLRLEEGQIFFAQFVGFHGQ